MLNIHKKNTNNLLLALHSRFTSPIILYGPPGTGKTYTLYKTLHSLKITPLYFPNPSTYTNTLLFTNSIAHTDIDTLDDLKRFLKNNTHPLNIIIETRNLYFLNKYIKDSLVVKFLYTTNTLLSKYNLPTPNLHSLSVLEEESLDRVACGKGVSKRTIINTPLSISIGIKTPLSITNTNPNNLLSYYNTSLSFYHFLGKIFYYNKQKEDKAIEDKRITIINNLPVFNNKLKDYLYENYLYFTNLREQGVIIDNLSLFDCYSEGVLVNVICVMDIEKVKPKCFYSFKSPYYLKGNK